MNNKQVVIDVKATINENNLEILQKFIDDLKKLYGQNNVVSCRPRKNEGSGFHCYANVTLTLPSQ
jgi:hypothetical protein